MDRGRVWGTVGQGDEQGCSLHFTDEVNEDPTGPTDLLSILIPDQPSFN